MNYDEFAFFNNQLAGMLRSGLPLEGSLRQLSSGMRRGRLQKEVLLLEEDLKSGTTLPAALEQRELPPIYKRLVQAGARGNNLSEVLVMMADYYQQLHNLANKLKGLMVYPIIVLAVALALTIFLSVLVVYLMASTELITGGAPNVPWIIWVMPVGFFLLLCLAVLLPAVPATRRWLRWRLPGFKDASIAQFSAMVAMLLKNGTELDKALAMMQAVEQGTTAGLEVGRWRELIQAGATEFLEVAGKGSVFPPLFRWLVAQGGEDLAAGFSRAAEVYGGRANQKAEILLNSALPVAVLVVGAMVVAQLFPFILYINQALAF